MFFECSGDHLKYSETYSNGKVVHYDRVFKQKNELMECVSFVYFYIYHIFLFTNKLYYMIMQQKMTLDDLIVTHVFKKVKDSEE